MTNTNGDVVSYTYDAYGNKTTMTYPDGRVVSYTYDIMNRMTSVTGLDGEVTAYAYDAAGRRVETASRTLTTKYGYDTVGNLLTQVTTGETEIAYAYSYNRNGYITGEERTADGQTITSAYAYDVLGQITSFQQSTGYSEIYAYDKVGNMTRKIISGMDGEKVALSMRYNKGNQMTSMTNGHDKLTYSYDKNGSMVKKVLSSKQYGKLMDTYAYNALDQLTSYTGYDGYKQVLAYDANGMRLSKSEYGNANRSTLEELLRGNVAGLPEVIAPAEVEEEYAWATTEYLYDITAEYYQVLAANTDGDITTYEYGLERIVAYSSNGKQSYAYDGRGSVATPTGYTPFGEQMGSLKVEGYGYNAEDYDAATGMINLRARQYEPMINRFAQKDLAKPKYHNPATLNKYCYCENSPVVYVDLDGKAFIALGIAGTLYAIKGSAMLYAAAKAGLLTLTTITGYIAFDSIATKANELMYSSHAGRDTSAIPDPVPLQPPTQTTQYAKAESVHSAAWQETLCVPIPGAAPSPYETPAPSDSENISSARKKSPSLPSASKVKMDTEHIMSGHSAGGNRGGPNKDRFPEWMTQAAILKAIREAYKVAQKIGPQQIDSSGEVRQLVEGMYKNMRIQMWVNLTTNKIETAWPK